MAGSRLDRDAATLLGRVESELGAAGTGRTADDEARLVVAARHLRAWLGHHHPDDVAALAHAVADAWSSSDPLGTDLLAFTRAARRPRP